MIHDITAILDVMPHRYPFLLVDRVLEIDGDRMRAIKNVTFNEPFFVGHFPGRPVMPGVLVVEAMAQAGGYLMLHTMEDRAGRLILFTGIDNCRFRRQVVPGDQLLFEVTVRSRRTNFAKIDARATVDGALVCEAQLNSAMVERT